MSKNVIITIGRQFGSGGREIGSMLAERLNLPLYDKNLVELAAEKLDISEDTADSVDETALSGFLSTYAYAPGTIMPYVGRVDYLEPINDKMFYAQAGIIRELAKKGPAIFIGRCADYVLDGKAECLNVFICADKADRIKRTMELFDLTEKKAADKVKKMDRERRYYYETYTGKDWGSVGSHDLVLNVSRMGMERAAKDLELIYKGMIED
ncbi:AAA family ATPase [Faecalicatena orotica]|uniref:cytidylate kinase-like family protein n=1 Tax=Faecalicatena orotica TaxID=1544 RepID=UPI0032162FBA